MISRRRILAGSAAFAASLARAQQTSPNDRIRIATIGFGGMGMGDTRYALSIPGVELAAVCDVYDGRLARAREVHGDQVFTTRDYRELLARKDIDAVIIATPDHWHSTLAIAAMEAGKECYLQKPMTLTIEQAIATRDAAKRLKRKLQVGTQYASARDAWAARKAIADGRVGKVTWAQN